MTAPRCWLPSAKRLLGSPAGQVPLALTLLSLALLVRCNEELTDEPSSFVDENDEWSRTKAIIDEDSANNLSHILNNIDAKIHMQESVHQRLDGDFDDDDYVAEDQTEIDDELDQADPIAWTKSGNRARLPMPPPATNIQPQPTTPMPHFNHYNSIHHGSDSNTYYYKHQHRRLMNDKSRYNGHRTKVDRSNDHKHRQRIQINENSGDLSQPMDHQVNFPPSFNHPSARQTDLLVKETRRLTAIETSDQDDRIATLSTPSLDLPNNQQIYTDKQVPEPISVVVSSSDNSYVSASPIDSTEIPSIVHTRHPHRDEHAAKGHHVTRFMKHSTSNSPKPIDNHHHSRSSINSELRHLNSDSKSNQIQHLSNPVFNTDAILRHRRKINHDHKFDRRLRLNQVPVSDHDDALDPKEEPKDDEEFSRLNPELTIGRLQFFGSDISTTATTTQRIKEQQPQNELRLQTSYVSSVADSEDQDDLSTLNKQQRFNEDMESDPIVETTSSTESIKIPEVSHESTLDSQYKIKSATIIKTRESIDMGATFINYTIVTNLNACLVECWITDSCDTAIYQESPVDFISHLPFLSQSQDHKFLESLTASRRSAPSNHFNHDSESEIKTQNLDNEGPGTKKVEGGHDYKVHSDEKLKPIDGQDASPSTGFYICYLFECNKSDGFKCQFSTHNYYVSSTRLPNQDSPLKSRSLSNEGIPPENEFGDSRQQKQEVDMNNVRMANQESVTNYAKIVDQTYQNHQSLDGKPYWHAPHMASIRVGQGDFDGKGSINSAIIAIIMGFCATGTIIVIVGHKMRSIRKRIAYRGQRRSLVPDAEYLINTMPI